MTAKKACGRHAKDAIRKRVKCRRPKAASDRRRARNVPVATPAAPLPADVPVGTGSGGPLGGTEPVAEPAGEAASVCEIGTEGEKRPGDVKMLGPGPGAAGGLSAPVVCGSWRPERASVEARTGAGGAPGEAAGADGAGICEDDAAPAGKV